MYKILVGNPEGKKTVGKCLCIWRGNIEVNLTK
jgi:hypothetical protein